METTNKNDNVKNILFVDNDNSFVTDVKDWIKKSEIETKDNLSFTFVQDAKSALKKLDEMNINMIILEITLPIVNGYYLINAIKNKNKDIPIIIYTSLKNPQDLAKMASSKVNNIFLKDLMRIQDLIEIIRGRKTAKDINEIVIELSSQIKSLHSNTNQSGLKLIQCPQCHLILAPDSHFCNNCGQKIFRKTKKILAEAGKKDDEVKKENNENGDIKKTTTNKK